MGETRERLARALLRSPMVDPRTGIVSREWLLWYEQTIRVQTGIEEGLTDLESDPQQGDVAGVLRRRDVPVDIPASTSEGEIRRLRTELERVQAFSEIPTTESLLNRAFQQAAQGAAGEGSPPAPQALNLGRRSGEYYRRWALAI